MTKKITDLEGRLAASLKRADGKRAPKIRYTPGPWMYDSRINSRGWGQIGLWDANGTMIFGSAASWDTEFVGPNEMDARLISAAPDLLEAAKKVEAFMAAMMPYECAAERDAHLSLLRAISKAERK